MTNTTTELQAQRDAAKTKAMEAVQNKANAIKMNNEITRYESEEFLNSQAKAAVITESLDKLKAINILANETVENNPQMSIARGEQYRWEPRPKFYGIGMGIEVLTGILTALRYSHRDHKAEILVETGTNEVYMEMFLNSLGNTTYFNKSTGQLLEAVPFNYVEAVTYLSMLEENLDITLDTKLFTETKLQDLFDRAQAKAENDQSSFELATCKANSTESSELMEALSVDGSAVA